MRRARITWQGAFHHVMNRGLNGEPIFQTDRAKSYFLECLQEKSQKLKIDCFAYCIMGNHYHLIIQNSSGRMADFLKQLNGQFGIFYRKLYGGIGYVFQNRYKSTLIEDDSYLLQSIFYCLLNPLRSKLVNDPYDYIWSSIHEYFSPMNHKNIVNAAFVEGLFQSEAVLHANLQLKRTENPVFTKTEYGEMMGGEGVLQRSFSQFDRRSESQSMKRTRADDAYFEPYEKMIWEFTKKYGPLEEMKTDTIRGKRLRRELLCILKDAGGFKYKDISALDFFSDLSPNSLGSMYRAQKNLRQKK